MEGKIQEPFAYIDPGTGGMIISSLWGIITGFLLAVAGFILTYFIRPLKRLLKRAARKKYIRFILIIVVIAIAGYAVIVLNPGGEYMGKKVLLIGIDAMDTKAVEKLMNEGKLPNLEKLKEAGGYSKLDTTIPPESPVAWGAAATGSNPGRYNIFDFVGRDPSTYLPKLNLAEESRGVFGTSYKSAMKGTPFWRITSGKGISTTVIRWPATFPPENVKGRMLSGLGVVDIKGFLNSYSFYTTGDYEKRPEDVGKVVRVSKEGDVIETGVFGPLVRKGNDLAESEVPMKIKLKDDHALIEVDGSEYMVETSNWSDWIRAKFSVDLLTDVYGIFRVYLLGTGPEFNMYVTSVQIDPENPVIDITYPREYGKELVKEIGLFATLGIPEDTKAVTENRIRTDVFLEQVKQIESERERMFWHEFNRFDEGVYTFAFDAGDRLQHIFWEDKVLSRNKSDISIAKAIEDYYTDKDRFIGEVLNKMDNETILIIFSDHGFSSFERAMSINTWLVENGYMTLTKNVTEEDSGSLFKYVDWGKTKAYSLGFASIFINLKGREGKGIVEEADRGKLIDEIIEKLGGLTDPKTGKRVITNLYKGEEIYEGEYTGNAPDIIIGFNEGYRMSWQNAVGGLSLKILMDNTQEWTGDHLIDRSHVPGVIFTNFGIKKENPSLMDIAPTVLSFLGLDIPEDMDGKSLVIE